MDARLEVPETDIAAAFALLGSNLKKRLVQHGSKSFIGLHEIQGVLEEEMDEYKLAVKANSNTDAVSELIDIGVGALFGVASLIAIQRAKEKKA